MNSEFRVWSSEFKAVNSFSLSSFPIFAIPNSHSPIPQFPHPHHLMLTKLINTQVNTEEISLIPGKQSVSFEIAATNYSDRFTSFWLEVSAAGVKQESNPSWYQITPGISTLNPPGDNSRFRVTILESPIPGFVGQINLTVKILALELNTEERQVIRLIVERNEQANLLQLSLPTSELAFLPNGIVDIPVRLLNTSQKPISVTLSLVGLNPRWFQGITEQSLNLAPEQRKEVNFQGQLPPTIETLATKYPFKIKTLQSTPQAVKVAGNLTILPQGTIDLRCDRPEQQIPAQRTWLSNWKANSTNYELELGNSSNLKQQVVLEIPEIEELECQVAVFPSYQDLNPGENQTFELTAKMKRPWWGWHRSLNIITTTKLSDLSLEPEPQQQNLDLKVYPILPLWLQGLTGLLVLSATWWLWVLLFRLHPHQSRINTIDVNGLGNQVISGSRDRTIRQWEIRKFQPRSSKILGKTEQPVRSLRYQPVNNNRVAVGLQNGEVQLWDILADQEKPLRSLIDNRADRVLDLEFTKDSRYLFSGHGSGLILQWDLSFNQSDKSSTKPIRNEKLSFAVYGLELVGQEQNILAIAGRNNELNLWDWQQDRLFPLLYPQGGKDDYITSLATAEQQPFLLATGDNQGTISLWNLRPCLTEDEECELIDLWRDGHQTRPIHSISLSADGCHLVTTGGDHRLKLWSLNKNYRRRPQFYDGQAITQVTTKLNSINLKQIKSQLQITTGGDDGRVRIYKHKVKNSSCSD